LHPEGRQSCGEEKEVTNIVQIAHDLAFKWHDGQFRRDGKTPYTKHLGQTVRNLLGQSKEIVAAGWLHDILEDTKCTVKDLIEAGIPECVIEAVKLLTKGKETYDEYLDRVAKNPIARRVKIADMGANNNDSPTEKQKVKYAKGILFLSKFNTQVLEAHMEEAHARVVIGQGEVVVDLKVEVKGNEFIITAHRRECGKLPAAQLPFYLEQDNKHITPSLFS
jgi:hypothetical protein